MTTKHSKYTVILIAGADVSGFCTDSNCEQSAKTEDTTTYGKNAEVYDPQLLSGAFGCGGRYETGILGPRAVLKPLVGTKVTVIYRPEGTGSGLPQDSFSVIITKYSETAPVAGYRLWTIDTQPSDVWDSTAQA